MERSSSKTERTSSRADTIKESEMMLGFLNKKLRVSNHTRIKTQRKESIKFAKKKSLRTEPI